jgi:hypothetical protein
VTTLPWTCSSTRWNFHLRVVHCDSLCLVYYICALLVVACQHCSSCCKEETPGINQLWMMLVYFSIAVEPNTPPSSAKQVNSLMRPDKMMMRTCCNQSVATSRGALHLLFLDRPSRMQFQVVNVLYRTHLRRCRSPRARPPSIHIHRRPTGS